jgi:8-oxo-(d)GTP phosphatase
MPMADAAAGGEIRAAGCVLWRPGARGPDIALVHRPRYDDWSLPKGKRDPGEHVLETAVREVAEETGVEVALGRRLHSTRYKQRGRLKVVDYWAATARQPAAGSGTRFVPTKEVDLLEWLPVPAARSRLSYPRDADLLDDFTSGPADTVPCVLLRHAAAGTKDAWPDDDLLRPLDTQGLRDAERVARLLVCYPQGKVISSPAERCVATVRPYATLAGLAIEIESAFAAGPAADPPPGARPQRAWMPRWPRRPPPDRTQLARERIEAVVDGGGPTVICVHRENLPILLDWACARLGAKPPEGPPLPKGGFWVLHIGGGTVVSVERHRPQPD